MEKKIYQLTFTLEPDFAKKLKTIAKKNSRSVAKQIYYYVKQWADNEPK